jgi:hypothetical protein
MLPVQERALDGRLDDAGGRWATRALRWPSAVLRWPDGDAAGVHDFRMQSELRLGHGALRQGQGQGSRRSKHGPRTLVALPKGAVDVDSSRPLACGTMQHARHPHGTGLPPPTTRADWLMAMDMDMTSSRSRNRPWPLPSAFFTWPGRAPLMQATYTPCGPVPERAHWLAQLLLTLQCNAASATPKGPANHARQRISFSCTSGSEFPCVIQQHPAPTWNIHAYEKKLSQLHTYPALASVTRPTSALPAGSGCSTHRYTSLPRFQPRGLLFRKPCSDTAQSSAIRRWLACLACQVTQTTPKSNLEQPHFSQNTLCSRLISCFSLLSCSLRTILSMLRASFRVSYASSHPTPAPRSDHAHGCCLASTQHVSCITVTASRIAFLSVRPVPVCRLETHE